MYSLHPLFFACCTQVAKVEVDMNPLAASLAVAGFPITSLLNGTPLAAISNKAVSGQVLDDVVSKLAQVVYSLAPSI